MLSALAWPFQKQNLFIWIGNLWTTAGAQNALNTSRTMKIGTKIALRYSYNTVPLSHSKLSEQRARIKPHQQVRYGT